MIWWTGLAPWGFEFPLFQVGMEELVKAVAAERAKLRGWSQW